MCEVHNLHFGQKSSEIIPPRYNRVDKGVEVEETEQIVEKADIFDFPFAFIQ